MSNRFSIYRRLLSYLAPYRAQVAVAYIGMLFASLLNLFVPQIIKTAIDQGIAAHSATALIWAGGLILGLAILRGIAAFVQRFYGQWLTYRFAYDIRNDFYDVSPGARPDGQTIEHDAGKPDRHLGGQGVCA